ncbi:MAG TPA: hypothetical protein VEB66_18035 [Opitutaceae bacterium]|nr:hypothetical protein [Opitutaceae bacterium]
MSTKRKPRIPSTRPAVRSQAPSVPSTTIAYTPPPRPDPQHLSREGAMAGHAAREAEYRQLDTTTSGAERQRRASEAAAAIAATYPRRRG